VLKPFFAVLFILLSCNSQAQNLEESVMILAQSLSGEVSTLISNVETILPDLENHLIDEQNPKPKIILSKVLGIGMSPGIDASRLNYLVAGKTLEDEEKLQKIANQFTSKEGNSHSYYFFPVQDEGRKLVLLSYQWKNRKILIFLEHDYFQSLSHGQTLLFQDIWLLNRQNLIISHSNPSWFSQKLSDLEAIKAPLLESDASGRWEGLIGNKNIILFYQTIPKTNLKLIGVQFPEKVFKKNKQFLIIGATLVILGLSIGYLYFKKTGLARQERIHQYENQQNKNPISNEVQLIHLDDFMKILSQVPLDLKSLEPYAQSNEFITAYKYVVQQREQNQYAKAVSPWASLYLDRNKFPYSWMSMGELFDKLGNVRFLTLDKIFNLIQNKDKKYKISPQAIQNILYTIHSFLQNKCAPAEIKSVSFNISEGCLEAKLVVTAKIKQEDLDWLSWIMHKTLSGSIISSSGDEYSITFAVPVENQGVNISQNYTEKNIPDISIKPLIVKDDEVNQFKSSIEDEKINELLSEDSLSKAIAILEDVPQANATKFVGVKEKNKLEDHFGEIKLEPRRPKALEIQTLVRKPKGK